MEIDWASATVKDGRLSVALSGDRPDDWADRFEHVIAQLAHGAGGWGEVDLGKRKLHVEDVEPGAEAELRHFLESAVLQANAATVGTEPGEAVEEDEPSDTPDGRMTAVFRSFAGD